MPAHPRRILLVALDNLGDLVFASALAAPLRAAFPDATIDVWCKQYTAAVAQLIPHIRRVIAADNFWAIPAHIERPRWRPFIESANDVRRAGYDVALLTGAPWRTAAAVATTRIPVRIALARHHNHHFLTHVLPAADPTRPVLEEQARLLGPLGVTAAVTRYELDASLLEPVRSAVAARLPSTFAALHPFASRRERCVSFREWSRIACAIADRGFDVLWVGTPGELSELRASGKAPGGLYTDQIGGSLAESAAAISLASVLIGHDSGPLHVAGAFGVPVVGVFTPGEPRRTFPQGVGPAAMIARAAPDDVTADVIIEEVDALFSRR